MDSKTLDEIVAEARHLFLEKHKEIIHKAENRTGNVMREVRRKFLLAERARHDFLRQIRNDEMERESNQPTRNTQNGEIVDGELEVVSITRHYVHEKAVDGLISIRAGRNTGVRHIVMDQVDKNPSYDAWVPVGHDFFVTEDELEPFVPYYDDKKSSTKFALGVYGQMLQDYREVLASGTVSDVEVGENGDLKPSKDPNFGSLTSQRVRSAQRYVTLELIRRYGRNERVIRALSTYFGVSSFQRMNYLVEIADIRYQQRQKSRSKKQTCNEQTEKLIKRIFPSHPQPSSSTNIPAYISSLNHYCFTCHIFACKLHEAEHVTPIHPILDRSQEFRRRALKEGIVAPCSRYCYLRKNGRNESDTLEKVTVEWSKEEEFILREILPVFGEDCCALSGIVGGKTCREVNYKLSNDSIREPFGNYASKKIHRPQQSRKQITSDENKTEVENTATKVRRWNASKKRKSARTVTDKPEEAVAEPRFIPCHHSGVCNKKNGCVCVIRNIRCESQCGCNNGRFCEGENGIIWVEANDEGLRSSGTVLKCRNRMMGCRCKSGYCNTDSCPCFENHRVCNPDFCIDCGCSPLPSIISIHDRPCRNVDIITSRHKKVFAGVSPVHGFGLFAGQDLNPGELVGPYCGRIMHTDLVDKILRVSIAKRITYAFNLTEKMTIDAGRLGGKVKFMNHNFNNKKLNCMARFERYRGEGRMVIKAMKKVKPGEELFFDYQLIDDEGNEWLRVDEGRESSNDDSDDNSDDESGESSDSSE